MLEQVAVSSGRPILRYTPNIWPVKGADHQPLRQSRPIHLTAMPNFTSAWIFPLCTTRKSMRRPTEWCIYSERKAAYGNLLIIDHGNGLTTRYGHLSRAIAKPGQKVKRGDVVGLVGTTGRTTAPHLHYEVRLNDRPMNPRKYLPRG